MIIPVTDTVKVTVSLDPDQTYEGKRADWWIVVETPWGKKLYWYTLDQGWMPSHTPIRVHFGPLFHLPDYGILDMKLPQPGEYMFYFGVDLKMNGILNIDRLFYDMVNIIVTAK